jgi:cytoskeletal protein RodZ
MLRVARERKGVDLYRVERDTKIRARHLDALESGDYAALPSAVYIKGFLRNYAVYLGLDPDETLARWRSETVTMRRTEAVTVAPPRPLAAPRRGPTFTPGIIVSALLSVLVIAFLGYVAMQVMRFSQSAEVTVDGSLVRTLEPDAVSTRAGRHHRRERHGDHHRPLRLSCHHGRWSGGNVVHDRAPHQGAQRLRHHGRRPGH